MPGIRFKPESWNLSIKLPEPSDSVSPVNNDSNACVSQWWSVMNFDLFIRNELLDDVNWQFIRHLIIYLFLTLKKGQLVYKTNIQKSGAFYTPIMN